MGVFHELLADGRGALPKGMRAEVFDSRLDHARVIQSVMAVKFFVFRGDKGKAHAFGHFGKAHLFVCSEEGYFRRLFVFGVEHFRKTFGNGKLIRFKFRTRGYGKIVSEGCEQAYEHEQKRGKENFFQYSHVCISPVTVFIVLPKIIRAPRSAKGLKKFRKKVII